MACQRTCSLPADCGRARDATSWCGSLVVCGGCVSIEGVRSLSNHTLSNIIFPDMMVSGCYSVLQIRLSLVASLIERRDAADRRSPIPLECAGHSVFEPLKPRPNTLLCIYVSSILRNTRAAHSSKMDDQHTIPTHYAILIGIKAYPNSSMESCVRDVQKIKECLESKLPGVDIQTLTASGGDTPLENPESWPTCSNMTSALEMVTSRAQPGDFIYIHYSGHGTRLDPCYELSNQSIGDLALVLLDEDSSRLRLLPGPRLAGLLKSMVDKALVITLVLDCCFSASVYRNGDLNVRYLSCGRIGALTYPPIPEYDLADGNTRSTSRDASMRDNWLLDPDRYTILAARGPHESAKSGSEANEKGERYGALSYFLFKTLSDRGLGRRHKDIHRHFCARFWESCQVKHPVLYGNEDQAFFGRVDPYRNAKSTTSSNVTGAFSSWPAWPTVSVMVTASYCLPLAWQRSWRRGKIHREDHPHLASKIRAGAVRHSTQP